MMEGTLKRENCYYHLKYNLCVLHFSFLIHCKCFLNFIENEILEKNTCKLIFCVFFFINKAIFSLNFFKENATYRTAILFSSFSCDKIQKKSEFVEIVSNIPQTRVV